MSAPEQYNGWWVSSDQHLGTSDTSRISDMQKWNAKKVYDYFTAQGWTKNAIAGMLGNFQVESFINPGYTETHRSVLESNAAMMTYDRGVGIAQWTGFTPSGDQKLVQFADGLQMVWYDGYAQMLRIKYEYDNDLQFDHVTVDGIAYTWANYITSSADPAHLAKVWQYAYERGGTDTERRQGNAVYWYNAYFGTLPIWLLARGRLRRKNKRIKAVQQKGMMKLV